ncbi:MAG: S-adenosyl-l-methionine hydroxide adenosyltransferase family protein [Candidatus Methylomirabilales bacterium]
MEPSGIITLLTDFGTREAFVGVMKGVILGIHPALRIVDLTHELEAYDIEGAGFLLATATPYFPPGTVHVAVVDPSVGSSRRPLVAVGRRAMYVLPDNGLLSFLHARGEIVSVHLAECADYFLQPVSATFHGRDVFAPVAAHLASGVPPTRFGPLVTDPVLVTLPAPRWGRDGSLIGTIIYVDRFGNLITNVGGAELAALRQRPGETECLISVGRRQIRGLCPNYAALPAGQIGAIVGSSGQLEIFANRGRASDRLKVGRGGRIVVRLPAGGRTRRRERIRGPQS